MLGGVVGVGVLTSRLIGRTFISSVAPGDNHSLTSQTHTALRRRHRRMLAICLASETCRRSTCAKHRARLPPQTTSLGSRTCIYRDTRVRTATCAWHPISGRLRAIRRTRHLHQARLDRLHGGQDRRSLGRLALAEFGRVDMHRRLLFEQAGAVERGRGRSNIAEERCGWRRHVSVRG